MARSRLIGDGPSLHVIQEAGNQRNFPNHARRTFGRTVSRSCGLSIPFSARNCFAAAKSFSWFPVASTASTSTPFRKRVFGLACAVLICTPAAYVHSLSRLSRPVHKQDPQITVRASASTASWCRKTTPWTAGAMTPQPAFSGSIATNSTVTKKEAGPADSRNSISVADLL